MNANLNAAIASLAQSNPSLVGAVMATLGTAGEGPALALATQFMTMPGVMPVQSVMIPLQPSSFKHADEVVFPFEGNVFEGAVVGPDLNLGKGSGTREGWYVVLIKDEAAGRNYEGFASYPADMLWPNSDQGKAACALRAAQEVQSAADTEAGKVTHRLTLIAGLPYSEEQLKEMTTQDKVSMLWGMNQRPFDLKGDRDAHILRLQGAFIKTKEGKEAIANAIASTGFKRETAKVVAPAPKVVAAPAKPNKVAAPTKVAAPAKIPAKTAAAPVVRKVAAPVKK